MISSYGISAIRTIHSPEKLMEANSNKSLTMTPPDKTILANNAEKQTIRVRRSEPNTHSETITAPASEPTEDLHGDLAVESNSLIAARIIATQRLLGDESQECEDEALLDLANQIHKQAQEHPTDDAAVQLSSALYAEECAVWGEKNNASALGVTPETVAKAYQEAWSLTLNPPSPPAFKTREEIAAADIEARKLTPPIVFKMTIDQRVEQRSMFPWEHVESHAEEAEIVQKYYAQFPDYIEKHLDRLCTAKAMSAAQQAGLDWLTMQYRPQQAWSIEMLFDPLPIHSFSLNPKIIKGQLVRLSERNFGLIDSGGVFHHLAKPASAQNDEWLSKAFTEILSRGQKGLPLVRTTPLQPTSSIQDMLQQQIRQNTLAAIGSWKENNYNPSTSEAVMRAIIPFYETAHKLKNDPGYTLTFKDVAWDVFSLGVTIASIATSAGLLKAAGTGLRAMKAMQGASIATRASMGIRTALAGIKTSTFLQIAGRELTDFIVPVFSAHSLVRASSQGSVALMRSGLKAMMRRTNIAAATTTNAAGLLNRIYDSLAHAHHVPSALSVMTKIDERAAQTIPAQLFRGQTIYGEQNFLVSRWGTIDAATHDDYLAACIRHTSRTGGSEGDVLSLTMDGSVATRFARDREKSRVFIIDTTTHPEHFRTVENILKNDGPRLVREGKVSAGTLAAAIKHSFNQEESEVFYMLGSIPDTLITMRPRSRAQLRNVALLS